MVIRDRSGDVIQLDVNISKGSDFRAMNLHGAILEGLDLEECTFSDANLRSAILFGTKLAGSDFSGAILVNADMRECDLSGCVFDNSTAMATNFARSNLANASLINVDISHALFSGAHLEGAVMLCTKLNEASLHGAFYNNKTMWTDDIDPTYLGAINVNEILGK